MLSTSETLPRLLVTSPPPGALGRLLRYLRPHRVRLALALITSLLCAAATGLYAFLVGPILRAVLLGGQARWAGFAWDPSGLLSRLPVLLVAVALVKATAQMLQNGWTQGLAQRALADLRGQLYARLLTWPPGALEKRHSGELLSRLTADVGQVEFTVSTALTSYLRDGLQALALLTASALIDFRLFLLCFVVLPLTVLPVARFARAVKRSAGRAQAGLGRLTTLLAEALHNLPVVQGYRAGGLLLQSFDDEQALYVGEMRRSLFVRGAFTPAVEGLGFFGVALAIAWGSRAVAHDPPLAQRLLSFVAAQVLMYQPIKALSGTFSQVAQGLAAAERLFELEDEPVGEDGGRPAPTLARGIELKTVRASYEPGREALKGLSLTVPKGQRVALVGASGAGKSTVFSLLLRFLEPDAGEVLWDGEPLGGFARASLRARLGWVPQEPVLFSGTVRQNLLLARADAPEEALWEALRLAHADGFVRAFPSGLDEAVGERGARMSGGQRQRLAIARAFLRRPSVLLLDEPTSALDAASEAEVQAGLAELMRDRTTLLIAHRLSTVRGADLIHVLEDGRVVESGTHGALAAAGGRYASLLGSGAFEAA